MKNKIAAKIYLLLAAIVLSFNHVSAQDDVSINRIRYSERPITDGKADDAIWQKIPPSPFTYKNVNPGDPVRNPTEADLSASMKAAWINSENEDGEAISKLYVLMEINDDIYMNDGDSSVFEFCGCKIKQTYPEDSPEMYLDFKNAKPDTIRLGSTEQIQLSFLRANPALGGGTIITPVLGSRYSPPYLPFPSAIIKVAQVSLVSKYTVEWEIDIVQMFGLDINVIKDNMEFGFDLSINDDDNGGERDSKISWGPNYEDQNYADPRNWNNATLKDEILKNTITEPFGPNSTEKSLVKNAFQMFPNPNEGGMLRIEKAVVANESTVVEILDLTGHNIRSFTIPAGERSAALELKEMSTGMYIVKISNSSLVQVENLFVR